MDPEEEHRRRHLNWLRPRTLWVPPKRGQLPYITTGGLLLIILLGLVGLTLYQCLTTTG